MNKEIVTGLMAYGMSGKVFHAPFIHAHPGFKLHAITERNQKNAKNDYPGIISYNTLDELFDDEAIELMIINTPNYTHFDYAVKALNAGKHILVEKPFTATSAEAKELFSLAEQVGKKIFFYQNRRWDSDFTAVRQIIESGKLGKLNEVHFRYDRYRATIGIKLFKEEPIAASGLMYDLGPHLLDQAISIFGKPESFHKILGKNRKDTKVDDYFSIHLSYPDSVNVFVHSNMLVVDALPAFVLNGTDGSLQKVRADGQEEQLLKGMKLNDEAYGFEAEGTAGKLTLIDEQGNKTVHPVPSLRGSYLPLFEAIYQSIVNDIDYPVTQEQVITQLEILEA
ncbi:Gfo/Idh/MocA family oxidoreductase [Pedobacter metabolipauper]|uniref:Putative dehydrogenase n=1 Tax=Pedobacter metabolipauper TaxID=425513 RepID=A0A4R6SUD6_9SPHI|nr:Gfo/Idh/MocA family oxidoreductase [Pedobacter metabolipauper]TDQ09320.1 putative dehydrogenase [Pedobacter metabolipauper]